MGFNLVHRAGVNLPATEYFPASAMTPKTGMCVALNASGQLAASAAPKYICLSERSAAVKAGELIPVIRITGEMVFETELDAAGAGLKAGSKICPTADGLKADADGTGANFELTSLEGTGAGAIVRGRFI